MSLTDAGQVKLGQVKFLWAIPNFAKVYREARYIYSPPFAMTANNVEWKFALLMRRHVSVREKSSYINIFIVRNADDNSESNGNLSAKIEFAVLDAFDNEVYRFKVTKNYPRSKILVDLAIEEAMIFENENCLLKDELRLVWIITSDEYVDAENGIHQAKGEARKLRLREFDSFGGLLNKEKFSDVILTVKGREIYAHKAILSNKSPVFERMFTHDMLESRTNRVDITDIDYEAMREFLRFIYTGKLSNCKVCDVFAKYSNIMIAADKYFVDSLKARSEEKLSSVLNEENVLDCLVLADLHNAANLKKRAINFIVKNTLDAKKRRRTE